MTTMDYTTTMRAMRTLKVKTGSLVCLGCGWEHNCSTQGCAILRNAVEHMAASLSSYDHLSELVAQQKDELRACIANLNASEAAESDLARQLAAAQQQMDALRRASAREGGLYE